jgi:hypothetical protein
MEAPLWKNLRPTQARSLRKLAALVRPLSPDLA